MIATETTQLYNCYFMTFATCNTGIPSIMLKLQYLSSSNKYA